MKKCWREKKIKCKASPNEARWACGNGKHTKKRSRTLRWNIIICERVYEPPRKKKSHIKQSTVKRQPRQPQKTHHLPWDLQHTREIECNNKKFGYVRGWETPCRCKLISICVNDCWRSREISTARWWKKENRYIRLRAVLASRSQAKSSGHDLSFFFSRGARFAALVIEQLTTTSSSWNQFVNLKIKRWQALFDRDIRFSARQFFLPNDVCKRAEVKSN